MQKLLYNFIWANGRPRCTHNILRKHRRASGMGAPKLNDYYMATLLDQARFWFQQSSTKLWCTLKQETIRRGNLSYLLLANSFSHILNIGEDHPSISANITAWKYFLNHGNIANWLIKIPLPLEILKFHVPVMLTSWNKSGISKISDIF